MPLFIQCFQISEFEEQQKCQCHSPPTNSTSWALSPLHISCYSASCTMFAFAYTAFSCILFDISLVRDLQHQPAGTRLITTSLGVELYKVISIMAPKIRQEEPCIFFGGFQQHIALTDAGPVTRIGPNHVHVTELGFYDTYVSAMSSLTRCLTFDLK